MSSLVVARADTGGPAPVDMLAVDGVIIDWAPSRDAPFRPLPAGATLLDARGGAVLVGLHDHHVHLRALAAARHSVRVGPPEVTGPDALGQALAEATARTGPQEWVRAVGYHEVVAGPLDRHVLDRLVPAQPVRVQHRSGAMWMLNSAAVERLGLEGADHGGIERDAAGSPTGRLLRMDDWLAQRVPAFPLDLAGVGATAAARGVTGFTDATAGMADADVGVLADALTRGDLPQRLTVMAATGPYRHPRLTPGAHKVVLDDTDLPGPDELAVTVAEAHRDGRPVALHCVTRAQLVVAVLALEAAGSIAVDRIEHGAVVPVPLRPRLAALGVTVVTNPGFVYERGDVYRAEVVEENVDALYPCGSLRQAGVAVAAGTDAPFGPADPWVALRTAVTRLTRGGDCLGPDERIAPDEALGLFAGRPDAPAKPRRLGIGQPADLCVLGHPRRDVLGSLDSTGPEAVLATVVGGEIVFTSPR